MLEMTRTSRICCQDLLSRSSAKTSKGCLEQVFASITLKWDRTSNSSSKHRKCEKVRDKDALSYYRSLFKKYLEGKEPSEELIDYVVNTLTSDFGMCLGIIHSILYSTCTTGGLARRDSDG